MKKYPEKKFLLREQYKLNGNKINKETGVKEEYCKKQFERYVAKDFSRFH